MNRLTLRLMWIFAMATGVILLLWLFCLPRNLFSDVCYSTIVTSADGRLLGARVADDGQWRFPPSDSVPAKFVTALIEYEDRSFYTHRGVNILSLARAVRQNISAGHIVSGGSTITMQTIRLHRRGERTFTEKFIEIFMATRLELTYSKREILRLYASHAPFGGNVVGIEAAAWRYLGNDGSDMSWAEAATLAVLQNAPSAVHLSKNRHRLLDKRNRLLLRLKESGHITDEEYLLAVDEPLIGEPYPMPSVAPHLVEYYNKVSHGRRTVTAVDFSLQQRLEELTATARADLALGGINDLAVVITSVRLGEVIAYCGNADILADRHGKWVDIARAPRSSGSILKPLLYAAAIQEGVIMPGALLPDVPADFGGFVPKNFRGDYSGVIPADEALALSLNVPNVQLLKDFGVTRFASFLKQAGFSTLRRPAHAYGLSLILGGAEVTLFDVVRCYTRLARHEPSMPLTDSVAFHAMVTAMSKVVRPDMLDYTRVASLQNIAWKTGTSYGARDGWAVGLTTDYVVGVWVGNADGTGVADLTGTRSAGPVMFDVFNLLPRSAPFAAPRATLQRVCARSGHLAGRYCTHTLMVPAAASALRTPPCPYCRELPVSLDSLRYVADASEPRLMCSYFILPPLHRHYYKQQHTDYVEPPRPLGDAAGALKILYPADGSVICLPKTKGPTGSLICKATHLSPDAQIFWHLDGCYLGTTTDIHQITIHPAPGTHTLSVCDHSGLPTTITFRTL